jgi:hypothetical protein
VFLSANRKDNPPQMKQWNEKIPDEKRLEYMSFLSVFNRSFANLVQKYGIEQVYVFLMGGEDDSSYRPTSVLQTDQARLINFALEHDDAIKEEFKKNITEWIPPDKMEEQYKFSLIQ